jgi:hypothetical protein
MCIDYEVETHTYINVWRIDYEVETHTQSMADYEVETHTYIHPHIYQRHDGRLIFQAWKPLH